MPNPGPEPRFHIETHGTADSVRQILIDLRAFVEGLGSDADTSGTIEIVMAEALNNIIEHAYAPGCEGPLWLSARATGACFGWSCAILAAPCRGSSYHRPTCPMSPARCRACPRGDLAGF